ncbi:hypothetical protein [Gemmatimonas sp.]|jgi:hypothetical protein|uniref:hypothetical protein n=1 Tax=Gemmatimonas sp. TaxID=1962908 RepID=UPI0037C0952C
MTPSTLRPLFSTVLVLACGGAATSTATSPTATARDVDADGVQMLFPSAPGASFRLGSGNPNATARLVVEQRTVATAGTDSGIRFWNLPSYPLNYSSGGTGLTSRLHIQATGAAQQHTWRTQRGYLSAPTDLRNQEFTVYVRAHGMIDSSRAMVTMKVRGGGHSASNGDLASCVMMTLAPANAPGGATRFGKELVHPDYDYVRLAPRFNATLVENQWVGIKMVSWNDPADSTRVINRLYLDTDPFDRGAGTPRNNWRLFSEYIDLPGKSTGRYNTAVTWGGWQTSVRTDGYRSIDFTLLSVREIVPPR